MRYPEGQKAGGGTWICAFFFLSALVVFCFLSLLRTVAQAAFTHDFLFFFLLHVHLFGPWRSRKGGKLHEWMHDLRAVAGWAKQGILYSAVDNTNLLGSTNKNGCEAYFSEMSFS